MESKLRRFSLSVLHAVVESKPVALLVKRPRRASVGVLPASDCGAAQYSAAVIYASPQVHVVDSLQGLPIPFESTSALDHGKVSTQITTAPYTVFQIKPRGEEPHESQASREPSTSTSTRRSSGSTDGTTPRRTSTARKSTLARHRTLLRMEVNKEVQLMKQNMGTKKPWVDAFHVIKIVSVNSITSSAVASIFAFLFSLGFPFQVRSTHSLTSPGSRRVLRQVVAVGCVLVIALGSVAISAFLVAKNSKAARRARSAIAHLSWRRVALRLLRKTWKALFLVVVATIGWMEGFSSVSHHAPRPTYHLQLFVLFATVYAFVVFTACAANRLYLKAFTQQLLPACLAASEVSLSSTSDTCCSISGTSDRKTSCSQPQEKRKVSATSQSTIKSLEVSPVASWKLRRIDRIFFFVVFNVAFLYLYASSYVSLDNRVKVFLYAAFSLVVKISLQEATKHFVLDNNTNGHHQILPPLVIHAAMTIPTVAIDAQIRLLFVRLGVGQTAIATSVSIVLCELIFRTAKILRLRHVINSRLTHNSGITRVMKRVNSKIAAQDVAKIRAEYSQFLVWKLHVLRLHAAEVYADMHGEYISMGCSIAIMVFFGEDQHSLFGLSSGCEDQGNYTLCSRRRTTMDSEQLTAVVSQVISGLVVDYVASVVEIIHEVPLLETINGEGGQLRAFLRVLLPVLAAVNVSVVALFYLKPA